MIKDYLELEVFPELEKLKEKAEKVAGQWNGDESGIEEDRAMLATDIVQKIDELKNLLEEFQEL